MSGSGRDGVQPPGRVDRVGNPTIYAVAELAGVSIKTVSRVINASPFVKPRTQERVEAAIAELGFRPNSAARRLAGSRSTLIGLLLSGADAKFSGPVQFGVARRCRQSAYHLVVLFADESNPETTTSLHFGGLDLEGLISTLPTPTTDSRRHDPVTLICTDLGRSLTHLHTRYRRSGEAGITAWPEETLFEEGFAAAEELMCRIQRNKNDLGSGSLIHACEKPDRFR